jgi:lipopolysaccharide transport system permease protein
MYLTKKDLLSTKNFFKIFLKDRYLGSRLGLIWSVITPFALFAIYTFVFGFVFNTKLPGDNSSLSYVIWLLSALAPWIAMTESIIYGVNSLWSNASIIKNIPVKIETITIASVLTGMLPLFIGLMFVISLSLFFGGGFRSTFFLLIPLVLLFLIFAISMSLILAPITVVFRDLSLALPTILIIILFSTPIFYSINALPKILQYISALNPFYIIIESMRVSLVGGSYPSIFSYIWLITLTSILMSFGLTATRRIKGSIHGFL